MNIAIVGLGNIGSYLYKFLSANIKQLEKKILQNLKSYFYQQNIKKKRKFKIIDLNGLKKLYGCCKIKKS